MVEGDVGIDHENYERLFENWEHASADGVGTSPEKQVAYRRDAHLVRHATAHAVAGNAASRVLLVVCRAAEPLKHELKRQG